MDEHTVFYFELLDKMLLSMLSFPAKSLRMTKALMFLNNIFKSLGHGNRPHRLLHERERERERERASAQGKGIHAQANTPDDA